MEEIYGYVENIVYSQNENGFTVARLKQPKKQELTCIVGIMPSLQPGETIRCKGSWKRHPEHGLQFEVSLFDFQAPADLVGIQKYLESGMIKGIGPVYANRIIEKFGLNTLEIIDQSPKRLLEIPGIGVKRVEKIESCWHQQKSVREVMIFLRSHGVSPSFAQKIFKTYGEQSIEKVKSNPFALAKEIFGIGFKSADAIARGLGIPPESSIRIDAGIEHVLWELSHNGHVCYPEQELVTVAQDILQVDFSLIQKQIEALIKNNQLFKEDGLIWLKPLYLSELGIAREIARIHESPSPLKKADTDKALLWIEKELKMELAKEQKEAVVSGITEKVLIITGGPGTGKSTITKAILGIISKLTDQIFLAAPTGRAAKRMTEITGKKASTIHSLLEMDFQAGGFKRNRQNPLECDFIIIDEASMIDTLLMHNLLKAIPSQSKLLIIGDSDQLPSVGPGNILKDLIASKHLKVVELKHIFRQAAGSRIIVNAHRVNQGLFPDLSSKKNNDFYFIESETPESILATIVDLVKIRLPKAYTFRHFQDIQVLSPMKKGVIGIENLNFSLQQALNPSQHPLCRMGKQFHIGDKVMQMRNNYQKEVYNGDIGIISEVDLSEQYLVVRFENKAVDYEFTELDELQLAYAVSIHKYQGSESPCIIIPIHLSHFKLLYRNLLYTGITRGKKLVILVGTKKALAIGVKNEEVQKRYTGLEKRLQELCVLTK